MSLVNDKLFDVNEIKPKEINDFIHNYHVDFDGKTILRDKCPACENEHYSFAFDKYNFHYVQCKQCMSLYVQNTIDKEDYEVYLEKINNKVYKTSQYQRYLQDLANETNFELEILFSRFLDNKKESAIAYMGLKESVFSNALSKFNTEIRPFDFSQGISEEKFDFVIVDHILEKSLNVQNLIHNIHNSLKKNGFIYILSRVGSGIDILTLWEDSKVFPIEHQNLLSIEGMKQILSKESFTIKELNTPGILDVDNILKSNSQNIPRFLFYLNVFNKEKSMEDFKIFLQKNLLSSFATIIAQKE